MTLATSQPAFPPGLRTHYAPLEHFPVLAAIPPAGVVSAAQAPPAPERGRCPPIGGVPFTMEETGMARTPSPSDPVALEDFGNDDSSRWAQIARRYRAPLTGFFAILCIALGAGAAASLNQWWEADIDVSYGEV